VEHLTSKQVEGYSLHQLPAAELLVVSDHLGECDACRSRVESALSNDAAFVALHEEALSENGSAGHLSTEQTADYVDRHLSGEALQFVNDHLTGCEHCALAVADLRAFRNEIAPSLDREYGPTTAPAVVKTRWREKFVSLFRVAPVPAFGGAALAMLLLAAIAWIIWRSPKESNQEVVVTPSPFSQPTPSVEPSVPAQPTAAVVAQLNDGNGVVSLDQEGKLSGADNLPAAYQDRVKRVLTSQKLERSSQLQGLTRPSSTLMGSGNKPREFAVVEPVGNVVLSNQPTFRWSALEGASAYVVEVYDDQFKLVASSPELTNRAWRVSQSLARGKVYSWQVKAIKEGQEVTSPRPPAPQAKFRVLDQAKANEIARAKRDFASSHLTLGLLYADAGLLREAEQEFRSLRRANPDSDVARNLLRQVQSLRH
jgi:anti-sigma factor RsiW